MHQIFAPDPSRGVYSTPRPLAGLGGGAPRGKGRREGGGKGGGKGDEGVPECPNPELASLKRDQDDESR